MTEPRPPEHPPHPPEPAGHPGRAVDETMTQADQDDVAAQLGRPLRGRYRAAHRCECGAVDVVATAPRLEDGTPFPTTWYLTCPRATAAASTLESDGLMRTLEQRLTDDPEFAAGYRRAHEAFIAHRAEIGAAWELTVPEIDGISAGGMPNRVKCLHALVGHALAAGPGVNPAGDAALTEMPAWWANGRCV